MGWTYGRISVVKHRIDLDPENHRLEKCASYRVRPEARQFQEAEINEMLKMKVIKPAETEWATPIVFAAKKDGSLRFSVDYSKLNAIIICDSSPILQMDQCIDSFWRLTNILHTQQILQVLADRDRRRRSR